VGYRIVIVGISFFHSGRVAVGCWMGGSVVLVAYWLAILSRLWEKSAKRFFLLFALLFSSFVPNSVNP